jgi:peroxiredoxin
VLEKFAAERNITYPLLSDPASQVIGAYGLRNPDATGRAEGVPHPGILIVAQDGTIAAKLFYEGYIARHGVEEVLEAAAAALP